MTSTELHRTKEWVEGANWDAEISEVMQDMREAFEARDLDKFHALEPVLVELEKREVTKGHYHSTTVPGLTEGDYFGSLAAEGKREYLKTFDIRVEKTTPTLEPGASRGIRVIIDDEDHGVFPYPPQNPSNP
jgi:hypothetical protein